MKLFPYFSRTTKTLIGAAGVLSVLGIQGCLKDFPTNPDNLGWKPSFAAPLATASLSLKDLLLNADTLSNLLKENPDKSLTLVYRSQLLSQKGGTSFKLPDETASPKAYKMTNGLRTIFNLKDTVIQQVIRDTMVLQLPSAPNAQVDQVALKSGLFSLNVTSTYQDSIRVIIDVPGIILSDGSHFNSVVNLGCLVGNTTLLIDNKLVDMTKSIINLSPPNKLPYSITVRLRKVNPAGAADSVKTSYNISSIAFSKVVGRFNGFSVPIPSDSIALNALKSSLAGKIKLANPEINLFLKNGFGIPIILKMDKFNATEQDGSLIQIPRPVPPKTMPLIIPLRTPTIVGQVVNDTISFNSGNSNIASVLSGIPKKFSYKMRDSVGGQTGFITDTAGINVSMEAKLPLQLSISGLILSDTIKIDLQKDTTLFSKAQSGNFRLVTDNQFPFGVNLQVYFYDKAHKKILDSLSLSGPVITLRPGAPDGTGRVTTPSHQLADFTLKTTQLTHLAHADHLITKAIINTYKDANNNQPTVQIFSDYRLKLQTGILVSKVDVLKK